MNQPHKMLRKRYRIITIVLAVLVVLVSLVVLISHPKIYSIDGQFHCLEFSMSNDEITAVEVQIKGTYHKSALEPSSFNGTIYIVDEYGKQHGGWLNEMSLTKIRNGYTSGTLFFYNLKTKKYDSLGVIFWNVSQSRFVIISEGNYIYYPAKDVQDLITQLDDLNMELVQ